MIKYNYKLIRHLSNYLISRIIFDPERSEDSGNRLKTGFLTTFRMTNLADILVWDNPNHLWINEMRAING